MFARFENIQFYFYNLVRDNISQFDGLLQESDIVTDWRVHGGRHISIVTNWIPVEDIPNVTYTEDWNYNELGFLCSITVQSGHEKNMQTAVEFSVKIMQRLLYLLARQLNFRQSIQVDEAIFMVENLETISEIENESDLLISKINIYGR